MSAALPRDPRVIVIGAGMSGILTGIRLRAAGIEDFVIYEKAASLGGTWRENTYPGLSCDVPSHHYVYSFAPNPDWSHLFSPGPEICAYFADVAVRYGIAPHIRYDAEVVQADYADGRWTVIMADGRTDRGDVVIAATGVLHHPHYPDIAGLDVFAGACFHSARWDHAVSLAGKRVGIVGTGSTAIQIVPAIVEEVAHLALFQRTAQWILPLPNPAYTDAERAAFHAEPQRMAEVYAQWEGQFNHTFARAVIGDERQMRRIAERCRMNLEHNVQDPELRRRLTPDYQVACKRLVMSDTFYPAIQRPNAELVTAGIERIEAGGVRTVDGELHELDVLVLATGFDGHRFMRDIAVTGRDGVTLEEAWAERTEAFRCVALPGFPNFFTLIGPNSPIGNFSLILIAEKQVDYLLRLIEPLRRGECRAVVPRADATRAFNDELRAAMHGTVWVSGCRSWYLDRHGTPVTWPWTFERFDADMGAVDFNEYELIA
ncbi:MAG: flavin-containing monooxygenase [Gammaproteobacteria bacterium]